MKRDYYRCKFYELCGLYSEDISGGAFDAWNGLDEETRRQCALVVQPYRHGGSSAGQPVTFEKASFAEAFAGCRI